MARSDIWHRLEVVLAAEAEAIRRADFSKLPALIAEKTRVTERLASLKPPPDAAALDQMRARSKENAVLLQAAQRGLHAARARIEALQNGGTDLRTYDRSGTTQAISAQQSKLERRA